MEATRISKRTGRTLDPKEASGERRGPTTNEERRGSNEARNGYEQKERMPRRRVVTRGGKGDETKTREGRSEARRLQAARRGDEVRKADASARMRHRKAHTRRGAGVRAGTRMGSENEGGRGWSSAPYCSRAGITLRQVGAKQTRASRQGTGAPPAPLARRRARRANAKKRGAKVAGGNGAANQR